MTEVTFDGHVLTDRFIVYDLVRGFMPRTVRTTKVSGRDGEVYRGADYDALEISMTIATLGGGYMRSIELRLLAGWLNVDGPRLLTISDDDGIKSYHAVPVGGDIDRWLGAESVTITFKAPDPAMDGASGSADIPSGGSVAFTVYGNCATRPSVVAPSAVRGSSGTWGVTLDGGRTLQVAVPTGSASYVSLDSAARDCSVDGQSMVPTLDSDWLTLEPGRHVIEMTQGTGDAYITWTERWL